MKKFGILGITLLSVVVLGACSSTSSNSSSESATVAKIDEKNLDGSYYSDKNSSGDVATIEIDGKDILFTALGNSQVGTIDTSKKTIKFKDEKATYKIVGNKIVLTYDNFSIPFKKGEIKKETPSTESKFSIDSDGIIKLTEKGDYIVGFSDIPAGTYRAVLTKLKYASDDDSENGTVTLEIDSENGSSDKYETLYDVGDEVKITLKKKDVIKLSEDESPTWEIALMTEEQYKDYNK